MLQITIVHYEDDTVSIEKIEDNGILLAQMKDVIDLDVCIPYVNRHILVKHEFKDANLVGYTVESILEDVTTESTTGIKCIKYTPC